MKSELLAGGMALNGFSMETVTVVVGYVTSILQSGYTFRQPVTWSVLIDLLVCLILQNNLQLRKIAKSKYRLHDDGLWCALLVPFVLLRLQPFDSSLRQLLVPVTLAYYVYERNGLTLGLSRVNGACCIYLAGRLTVLLYSMIVGQNVLDMAWIFHLWTMLWLLGYHCPLSFTFGEIAIASHLHLVTCYCIVEGMTSQDFSILNVLAVVIVAGIHVAVLVLYVCTKTTFPPLCTWCVLVGSGLFYAMLVVMCLFQGQQLSQLMTELSNLFLSRISLLLLTWWSVLSLSSGLLVCYYGNQCTVSLDKSQSLDQSPDTYGKKCDQPAVDSNLESKDSETLYKEIKPSKLKSFYEDNNENDFNTAKLSNFSPKSNSLKCNKYSDSSSNKSNMASSSYDSEWKDSEHHDQYESGIKYKKFKDKPSVKCGASSTSSFGGIQQDCIECGTGQVSSSVRKYFHLMMLLVYVPGLVFKRDLLFLASCGATAVLVMLEAVRVVELSPLGGVLNQYLSVFLDTQDSGNLILTPLYLIVGCSLPLWFLGPSCRLHMALFAGLLSVGVGDSAASIIGRRLGFHKWPGSHKSIEGTLASVVCQLTALTFLHGLRVEGAYLSITTALLLSVNAFLEASTLQIDNLVVPVFTFLMFVPVLR